jgi:hypothetical protein
MEVDRSGASPLRVSARRAEEAEERIRVQSRGARVSCRACASVSFAHTHAHCSETHESVLIWRPSCGLTSGATMGAESAPRRRRRRRRGSHAIERSRAGTLRRSRSKTLVGIAFHHAIATIDRCSLEHALKRAAEGRGRRASLCRRGTRTRTQPEASVHSR